MYNVSWCIKLQFLSYDFAKNELCLAKMKTLESLNHQTSVIHVVLTTPWRITNISNSSKGYEMSDGT